MSGGRGAAHRSPSCVSEQASTGSEGTPLSVSRIGTAKLPFPYTLSGASTKTFLVGLL